jgi:uncharacterized protein YecE (DUF72 family)
MDTFDRYVLRDRLASLAERGVFLGSSSWKYPGWLGAVYDEFRYHYRGRFAQSRFDRSCLAEYAETFKTVCVDAAYYSFPRAENLQSLAAQVPADFRFGFKVTDAITVKRFPELPRFGPRAGQINPDFLNVDTFVRRFLEPCLTLRPQIGILIFELSRFHRTDFPSGRAFLESLDRFLGELPAGWPYGIELRNREWLTPEYFACLARHNVAHVFNSWTKMPTVTAQLALAGSRSNPNLVAGRFLVTPGTLYETSVAAFEPFDAVKQVDHDARAAAATLIAEGCAAPDRRTFLYVNNRLEGSAPWTIDAMVATTDRRFITYAP